MLLSLCFCASSAGCVAFGLGDRLCACVCALRRCCDIVEERGGKQGEEAGEGESRGRTPANRNGCIATATRVRMKESARRHTHTHTHAYTHIHTDRHTQTCTHYTRTRAHREQNAKRTIRTLSSTSTTRPPERVRWCSRFAIARGGRQQRTERESGEAEGTRGRGKVAIHAHHNASSASPESTWRAAGDDSAHARDRRAETIGKARTVRERECVCVCGVCVCVCVFESAVVHPSVLFCSSSHCHCFTALSLCCSRVLY